MKRRRRNDDGFAFTADRFGRPGQARITSEALACLSKAKIPQLPPRQVRKIYFQHHVEIDRIARLISRERKDVDAGLVITGADIQRLRRF
jgi:hypothetical protein